jgi:sec-independent protein translocase protein TatB
MGFTEILLILVIALILFGPEDLPEIARKIGKVSFELRKATNELTKEFKGSIDSPKTVLNKAFEETTKAMILDPDHQTSSKGKDENAGAETLLTYEDEPSPPKELSEIPAKDPLAELPAGIVSYEEKGASR